MTEDEAKTKWCHRKTEGDHFHASNRCIGSACMAWRWDMDWESSTEEGFKGNVVIRLKRLVGEPKMGSCGLAGKP